MWFFLYIFYTAHNDRGYGMSELASSEMSPRGTPLAPSVVELHSYSGNSIQVKFDQTANAMGDAIDAYMVQWSPDSTFDVNLKEIELPGSFKLYYDNA